MKIELDFLIRLGKSVFLISATKTGTKKIETSIVAVIVMRGSTIKNTKKNLIVKEKSVSKKDCRLGKLTTSCLTQLEFNNPTTSSDSSPHTAKPIPIHKRIEATKGKMIARMTLGLARSFNAKIIRLE